MSDTSLSSKERFLSPFDALSCIKDEIGEELLNTLSAGTWMRVAEALAKRWATPEPPAALSELQSLASHLGGGGIDCTDAAELGKRIRWAVDHHIRAMLERAASEIEPSDVTTLFDKDYATKRDVRESDVRRRLAAEIRSLMPEGRAPQPPGDVDARLAALAYTLHDLQAGIAMYATDTVWYSGIQTAYDRIDEIIKALPTPTKEAPPIAPATACFECRGSGQICTGNSGQEVDGYAPILERCEACDGTGVAGETGESR